MVNAGIDFEMLLATYKNSRNVGLVQLLTAPNSEKKRELLNTRKLLTKLQRFSKIIVNKKPNFILITEFLYKEQKFNVTYF